MGSKVIGLRNLGFACLTVLACSAPAAAQEWPTRFITMIVPFGTGSASDTVARIFAPPAVGDSRANRSSIENVGGAGGTIGAAAPRRQRPTATRW